MRRSGLKSITAIALLGFLGAASTTRYPAQAYVFVREMEKTSRGGNQVSIWERVVYSLIEAKDQGADCRAPRSTS